MTVVNNFGVVINTNLNMLEVFYWIVTGWETMLVYLIIKMFTFQQMIVNGWLFISISTKLFDVVYDFMQFVKIFFCQSVFSHILLLLSSFFESFTANLFLIVLILLISFIETLNSIISLSLFLWTYILKVKRKRLNSLLFLVTVRIKKWYFDTLMIAY